MNEVAIKPSSSLERVLASVTVVVVVVAQGLSGVDQSPWWLGAAVAIAALALWLAVHVNALDRPRVGNRETALLSVFAAVSVVVATFWNSDGAIGAAVAFTVAAISALPLAIYFLLRR